MSRKLSRIIIYSSIGMIVVLMLYGWWLGSVSELTGQASKLIAIGRFAGIIATICVLLELLVMSRAPFIENNFDLEELNDFHRYNGYAMVFTLIAHIIFLVMGYGAINHLSLWPQFMQLNNTFEDVLKASIGSIVFFVAAISSVKIARRRIPYEIWYFVHIVVYGGVLLAFGHQVHSGGDIVTQSWMRMLWYVVYAGIFGLLLYYRFLRQIWYVLRFDFKVERIEYETKDIYSIYIRGKNMQHFRYLAGNYAQFRFLNKQLWLESHPFSFSSVPGNDFVRITVRASGDYTTILKNTMPNTRVLIDGPRGSFTEKRAQNQNVLLVAGGIGVAPYTSLAKKLLDSGKNVHVLYSVHGLNDAVMGDEFAEIKQSYSNFRLTAHDTSKIGRIDSRILSRYVSGYENQVSVYVCGPDAMTQSIRDTLTNLNIQPNNIIAERFTF